MITQAVCIALISVAALAMPASAKTGSTIYTPERVGNARRNIARYDWAKAQRDRTVADAGLFGNQSDDFLWNLPTSQEIPRGITTSLEYGCPNCGKAIEKFGNYPWKVDVIAKPWKIECPNCGEVFPKNDFGKFYESGKDANGVFHYDKADRALLFNVDHPDPKDPLHNYGVDDTMGYKDGKGRVYRIVGYYGHYGSWAAAASAMRNFRDAYVYTGDVKWARKATILLYRVAEFYPDMDYSVWSKRGFYNSDGNSGMGKIYGRIWEPGLADAFITTYDAIYPMLGDSQLLTDLSKRTGKTITATDQRGFVEKNIVREVHDGIINHTIEGNEGMYQLVMARAAICLDEPGTTDEWLDWIFADGDVRHGGKSGGNMVGIFRDKVDDDGFGEEASPGYNSIWRGEFRNIAELLQLYPRYTRHGIVNVPKYAKMFEAPVRLTCADRYAPNIGDYHNAGSPGLAAIGVNDLAYAYRTFKDPKFAQMAYFVNGNRADGIRMDIFDPEPEAIKSEIESVVKERGPYAFKTDNMASYGCALLRSGAGDSKRALSLYYGRNIGHGHKDTLNIELFAHGLSLMPDLGYPEYATNWPSRYEWTEHTISHNTVTVDRFRQETNLLGRANFVVEGKGVSAAEISSSAAYPQTSLYQRTVAMIDVSDTDSYVVDIFRVKGGKEHMYSLHGAEGEVETEGLNLVDQPKGTLAGESVEPYADLGLSANGWAKATGYQYLYDVRRDTKPSAQPAVTYKVVDTHHALKEPKDVRLRINLISPPGEVILAHGDPPRNKPGNPRRLWYVLSPHSASESTFVSVIEPYVGSRTISKIERSDDGNTVTLTITTASGRVDTVVSALKPVSVGEFSGRFCVISKENGRVEAKLKVE